MPREQPNESVDRANRALRSLWILANVLGFSLGGALGGHVGRILEEPHVGISSPGRGAFVLAVDAGVALGAFGAAVGLAQWLALRRRAARVGWWAPATAAGWAWAGVVAGGLSGAIGGAVTDVGGDVGTWGFVVAAVAGVAAIALLPGALQALVVGRDARSWAPASAAGLVAGWAVGAPVILVAGNVLGLGLPSGAAWAIGAFPMGLLSGAITGTNFVRLVAARRDDIGAAARFLGYSNRKGRTRVLGGTPRRPGAVG
jgi:hypothetical protein